MDRISGQRRITGFTLVELLMVLAIMFIVLQLGLPAMTGLIQRNQLRTEASRLLLALNLARNEAVSRNLPVSLCPSDYATSGSAICSGGYAGGWIVFSNRNRDGVVDPGADEVLRAFHPLPRGFTLLNRAGTRAATELLTYRADGASYRNLTLMVCAPPSSSLSSWSVVVNLVGRPRLARDWGDCPAG